MIHRAILPAALLPEHYSGSRSGKFGGEYSEIAFGQTIDFVGKDGNFYLAPAQQEIGVMALFFGYRSGAVDDGEGFLKIGGNGRPGKRW